MYISLSHQGRRFRVLVYQLFWLTILHVTIVHLSSVAQSCPTLCDPMDCSTPGFPVHHNTRSLPSCPLSQWCHPTMSSSVVPFSSCFQSLPPSWSFPVSQFFPSGGQSIGVSTSVSVSPSNEYSGLTSFRIDWLYLLAVQGTLKSLLQHHNSKGSILWCLALFIIQLSHPYMTTGKTIALTRWTFVDKVMSLLFNMLSRLAITFLPKSKRLLISWLQSPSAVTLQPKKMKSATLSVSVCHEVMGTGCHDLSFLNVEF